MKRAFELDFLRGLSVFLMILHHFIVDIRYIFEIDLFAFQESLGFIYLVQPFFVCIFIVVSGICCQFSHDNFKRALKLFGLALGLSLAMAGFSILSGMENYVFFNILHLLAVGTFLYAVYDWIQKKTAYTYKIHGIVFLILLGGGIIYLQKIVEVYQKQINSPWGLIWGFYPENFVGMADYLPIIPWLGFFFLGVVIGQVGYPSKKTLFPKIPSLAYKLSLPFQYLGKKSLLVYLVHQPLVLLILFGLRKIGFI